MERKNKNRLYLKNWCPISLLNTDYKILTKLLANRLKKVLPSIINDDQAGYLEGRFIGQNIRLIEDISFFTKNNNKPGIILSIDFEKAFDSVNWTFLTNTLKHLNFGEKIISYIHTVYNNIEATVINNGNTSKFFKLERGVRQGCPLSAYLFIIIIEMLANKIRSEPNIKGIIIDKKEIKISLLADDATCLLSDLISLEYLLKLLKLYHHSSGLKINIDKTQAKYIGSLKNNDYFPHGLSWIKKPIESLGIVFTDNTEQNYLYNFKPKLLNLKTTLQIWKQRKLSLKGKITIINSIALSPLIYIASVIATPNRVFKEIDEIIQDFLWNSKSSKISKITLSQTISKGGLKLSNFQIKTKALQLSWVKRLTNNTKSSWKELPKYFYSCNNLFTFFNSNHTLLHNKQIPEFYYNIHKEYMKNFKLTPTNITQIQDQSLWLNKHITINNKIILWNQWQKKGISTINNLLNKDNKFLTYTEINNKFKVNCTHLDIRQIISSIPKIWKEKIKINTPHSNNNNEPTLKIEINNTYKNIQHTTCKDFYWHLINKTEHTPQSKTKWSKLIKSLQDPEETVWRDIYNMSFKITRETKLQTLQYRIIHRIIPCNEWLFNIKIKDNKTCNFCNEIDDIAHFFIYCKLVKLFWKTWSKWWNSLSKTDISNCNDAEECILFGFHGEDDLTQVLNYIILTAKEYIYIQRLTNENRIDFLTYLPILKKKLYIEELICKKNNTIHKFKKFHFIYENI